MNRVFFGRMITQEEIALMKWVCQTYPGLARSELAGTVCELIGWTTPSGEAKIPQCRACLATLDAEGVLDLPASKTRKAVTGRTPLEFHASPPEPVMACEDLELFIARPGASLRRWRAYMDRYHPLGGNQAFGSRLHYFIRSNGIDLGCLQFSASSWALASRDKWIGWSVEDRKTYLHLIVNNSRFLVLPNNHIRNFASRALALAARRIVRDWADAFNYSPVLLETFVDSRSYRGTCYKAANWIFLGHTQGRGRMDRFHDSRLSRKLVFVYPLRPDFRDVLTRNR